VASQEAASQSPRVSGQASPPAWWHPLRLQRALLVSILVLGTALRLYGLNWDGGHWLHPDERKIYFVTLGLRWPANLAEALTAESPLNPRFFAYGSLPFYLLRLVVEGLRAVWPAAADPDNLHFVGRPLVALLDMGTIVLTYRLARRLWGAPPPSGPERTHAVPEDDLGRPWAGPLLVAALVSVAVLHLQQAHFYTADTLLVFLVMLTLNLAADVAQGGGRLLQAALGLAFGLALATKLSAAPLVVALLAACALHSGPPAKHGRGRRAAVAPLFRCAGRSLAFAALAFFLVQPYALIDWHTFARDTLQESRIAWGALDVPYTRQYAARLPYLYPMWQTTLWGLGLPLGCLAWAGLGACLIRWLRVGQAGDTLLLSWAGPYLAITGLLHAQYLRYMLPLVPILCILAVQMVASWPWRGVRHLGYGLLALGGLVYGLAFVQIYAQPHSWVSASEWIYRHLPAGSALAVEEWDTALPLPLELDGRARRIEEYQVRTLRLYAEPDDATKWAALASDLAESEWLILASRRSYGPLTQLPERYPLTSAYYDKLFAGELGFVQVAEFQRGPPWLNPRLPPLPGSAPRALWPDESFVVYDHPRVLLLANIERLDAAEIGQRLP
jgi:4-amino-4-deoxy-L-arabinose transferase-like glycosyltransferase